MNVMTLERTRASRQFSDDELKRVFDALKKDYNNDFILMFLSLFLEVAERCTQLESKLKELEARKR